MLLKNNLYKTIKTPENIRHISNYQLIDNAGWHISYYGDDLFIIKKIESYSEQQTNTERNKDKQFLNNCINDGILFFSDERLIRIPFESNNNLPKYFKNKNMSNCKSNRRKTKRTNT